MARSLNFVKDDLFRLTERATLAETRQLAALLREVCEHIEALAKAVEDASR
jgi:hypothetical protein